ncbi:hypothetical protein SDC9_194184 [bioreactor metagenome]|uniref:Uncharacterized protein n=1 Tax=bioreactor metagenome TaxID=1076179 RepID=A0A645IGW0_9ZZZZ
MGISLVEFLHGIRKPALFFGYRYSLEDAVVSATDLACLVFSKMRILRNFHIIHFHITGYSYNRFTDNLRVQSFGCFADNVTHSVTDKHLNGNLRILVLHIAEIDNGPCNSVRHLIRMARVHFFIHRYKPLL